MRLPKFCAAMKVCFVAAYFTLGLAPDTTIGAPLDFAALPASGMQPLTVSFTNLSSGYASYQWNFGDGPFNNSTNVNPTHTFTNAGNYPVTLWGYSPGATNLVNHFVLVTNPPPPDFAALPASGMEPLTVSFTNLSSGYASYRWDFGDGSFGAFTDVNPTHTFTYAGTFYVSLTGVSGAWTNWVVHSVVVTNPAPPEFVALPASGME